MTARRPNVPRAGRSTPRADPSAAGITGTPSDVAGTVPPAQPRPRPANPAPSGRSWRGAGPSATKDLHRTPSARRTGTSVTKEPRGGERVTRGPRHPTPGNGLQGPASRHRPPVGSASEDRAAEREHLAGGIRRGGLGSRRVDSPIQPAEEARQIPARTFSGRLLALAVVLIAVIVLMAPSVSRYLQQQAEVDALQADIALQEQEQADHRSELARWDDPAFVKQQARERIFLVMPGETRYLVKGGAGIEDGTGGAPAAGPAESAWVDSFWDSITRAATD